MKIGTSIKYWIGKLGKYKYAALVLLFGICLMCIPKFPSEKPQQEITKQAETDAGVSLEQQLEELLSQMEGAGKVRVLLSVQSGVRYEYHRDMQSNTSSDTEQLQSQTVFYREGNSELPVLIGTEQPVYRGAVVVCEGADRASVQLNIVRAVSGVTGLSSDRITVIKMNTK